MKRSYRILCGGLASAGLLGAGAAAVAAAPTGHASAKPRAPITSSTVTGNPSQLLELARLKAELGQTGSDSRAVAARIKALQAEITRTALLRQQRAVADRLAAERNAQNARQAPPAAIGAPGNAVAAQPTDLRPGAGRTPSVQPPTSSRTSPPVVHTSTGASGAKASGSGEPGDDQSGGGESSGGSGGGDD